MLIATGIKWHWLAFPFEKDGDPLKKLEIVAWDWLFEDKLLDEYLEEGDSLLHRSFDRFNFRILSFEETIPAFLCDVYDWWGATAYSPKSAKEWGESARLSWRPSRQSVKQSKSFKIASGSPLNGTAWVRYNVWKFRYSSWAFFSNRGANSRRPDSSQWRWHCV